VGDQTTAMALEIAADLARKESAGSRYLIKPERIGEIAAIIIDAVSKGTTPTHKGRNGS